jgi:hypothetical protein
VIESCSVGSWDVAVGKECGGAAAWVVCTWRTSAARCPLAHCPLATGRALSLSFSGLPTA